VVDLNSVCNRQGDKGRGRQGERFCWPISLSPSPLDFLPLLRLHERPPAIVTAIRADHVGRLLRATLGAGLKLLGLERVVGPTHSGAGIRLLALGDGHGSILSETLVVERFVESTTIFRQAVDRQERP
jgi:hypothetical protein